MTSSSPPAKKLKKDTDDDDDDVTETKDYDSETQKALEEIDACQNQIDALNEKASEDILRVEQRFNRIRKPLFEKRNEIINRIPNFWVTAFVNHPQITTVLDEEEEDCLHFLNKLEVEEFEDIKFGYKINFHFEPNPYLENKVLTKEFHLGVPGKFQPMTKHTPIKWKEGQDIIKVIRQRDRRLGRKRGLEAKTFFTWYVENCDPTSDEIAEVIKDDLWPNPLQYYLVPDVDVDAAALEVEEDFDDGSDDGDADRDGDDADGDADDGDMDADDADDSVVVLSEVEDAHDDEDEEDDDDIVIEDDDDAGENVEDAEAEPADDPTE